MDNIIIENEKFLLEYDIQKGTISRILLSDGFEKKELLFDSIHICSIKNLEHKDFKITEENKTIIKFSITRASEDICLYAAFEINIRGYVICDFSVQVKTNNTGIDSFLVGIPLLKETVFNNNYEIKNIKDDGTYRYGRAISVNYSTDKRPVTNSVDFILESINDGKKVSIDLPDGKFLGWELNDIKLNKKGQIYKNRWLINFSGIDNQPNKIRGQRIYHWYGMYPQYPSEELLEEMAEYGCSVFILHMPSFKYIDGSLPADEKEFERTVETAHRLNMKVMFYCQPFLLSHASPVYNDLESSINDNGKVRWHSMKDTQVVFYKPNSDYDCDELCLRCDDAYKYVKESVLDLYKKYNFDGLYIDFAWPGQAVCTDPDHNHKPGLFNFYDYLRLVREWRKSIGEEALMIGHGGSIMVSSDYAEGFDACLTGEGQKDLLPDVIGVQSGMVPTLWTMHRRKEKEFRSKEAMSGLIREGVTPHIGLGIIGKSIKATLDPAHTPHYIALWQMWRAFPVSKSVFYNYLTENVVEIDNDEITYSMYITSEKQILLIVSNKGGPKAEKAFAVEANIKINIEKLSIPAVMKCWKLKGNTYETFRITDEEDIINGKIRISEIGINEFIGVVLSPDKATDELLALKKHLDTRFDRLPYIYKNKMNRLIKTDIMIEKFNKSETIVLDEGEFMKDRVAE